MWGTTPCPFMCRVWWKDNVCGPCAIHLGLCF